MLKFFIASTAAAVCLSLFILSLPRSLPLCVTVCVCVAVDMWAVVCCFCVSFALTKIETELRPGRATLWDTLRDTPAGYSRPVYLASCQTRLAATWLPVKLIVAATHWGNCCCQTPASTASASASAWASGSAVIGSLVRLDGQLPK